MADFLRKCYESLVPYEKRYQFYKFRHPKEFIELRKKINPSPKGDFSLKPFDEYQAIFVHITKTAGTAVAKSLLGYLPYHYTAIEYRVIYGKDTFNSYFKFAFVRNPWDRLYSAYRYLKAGGWNAEDREWANANLSSYNDFNEFVIDWLSAENIRKHIHFKPQYEFIYDDKGNLLIDYIGYFETINEDFNAIGHKLGINTKLATHNANPGQCYTEIYNEQSKQRVAEIYCNDIERFGYRFDGIEKRNNGEPGR